MSIFDEGKLRLWWLSSRRAAITATKVKNGLIKEPKPPYEPFRCGVCGRFAKFIRSSSDYWTSEITCWWDCKKCGKQSD